jgi:hypothetical protein
MLGYLAAAIAAFGHIIPDIHPAVRALHPYAPFDKDPDWIL